ncbi:MAG TPA: PVC-type heme-binding CxxCH protein [Chthoniobacteraceae bacterium]
MKEGDRVLFLGDTLLERENNYGTLETRLHEQFPDRRFTVRNLSWAGDTPRGWSRASFDGPDKGWERLKEQIAHVNPTVVFLGYGMAASLQELTDRSGDHLLNPDPARYGTEPMSAVRFQKELAELVSVIRGSAGADGVRLVFLSPIRHEDLRGANPGRIDPTEHNRLLDQYANAVKEVAGESGSHFIDLFSNPKNDGGWALGVGASATENGIHLTATGHSIFSGEIATSLGWRQHHWQSNKRSAVELQGRRMEILRAAIVKKNDLFFHRFRPANSTYLFGFRKHEQGQNAKEITQFDPLIEAADAEIDRLKRLAGGESTAAASAAPAVKPVEALTPVPHPDFTVAEGYQIELWAENPLLEKPTQMNWDALGRLWVCSSSLYPQIAPGEPPHDKILILEDTDRDGKADKSTVFADGLLIPTGVEPDLAAKPASKQGGAEPAAVDPACYVGQSTELLRLVDRDGDGRAEEKRIVFSGFGTEDTHHIIHTLHWSMDGRLYFNQSVYIHSHIETPYGMVRLNSGGIFAYNPQTERLEVFARGWWNAWGHQMDRAGQSFTTDGAGSIGISWLIPGGVYQAYEGGRRIAPGISPGSYPKFCGLELIYSPHFPADWQGNAITCDFRAHRIVRFTMEDLSTTPSDPLKPNPTSGKPTEAPLSQIVNAATAPLQTAGSAGYLAKEQQDLVRTNDLSFRPIDVKLGPDGALYVADWSNPIIQHGEVDFRDQRRDKHRGRIWRITKKDAPLVKWEPLLKKDHGTLRKSMEREEQSGESLWKTEQAAAVLRSRFADVAEPSIPARKSAQTIEQLTTLVRDPNPRVRLEAIRALAEIPTVGSAELVLETALKASADPFLEYATWLSINELAKPWTEAIARGEWKIEGREAQLAYGLTAIQPQLAGPTLSAVLSRGKIDITTGPWIELIGKAGDAVQLQRLLDLLTATYAAANTSPAADGLSEPIATRVAQALAEAARTRNARPANIGDFNKLLTSTPESVLVALLRLAGSLKLDSTVPTLQSLLARIDISANVRRGAIEALGSVGSDSAVGLLTELCAPAQPLATRRTALIALATTRFRSAAAHVHPILASIEDEQQALETWRELLKIKEAAEALARFFSASGAHSEVPGGPVESLAGAPPQNLVGSGPWTLPKIVASAGLRAAREVGKKGEPLAKSLAPMAGVNEKQAKPFEGYGWMADLTKRDGNPARGELVYRRANLACVTCHAIGGAGGKVGPEMTSLGASAPLDYIIEAVLNPAAKVKEGYNAVAFTLKDNTQLMGIQARETAQEVFVRDVAGNEQAVVKANIASKTDIGSIMPAGLVEQLSERDRWDLFAFLGQLGKPGSFDASKGRAARVWTLYPAAEREKVLRGELKNEQAANAFTFVDGRLPREQLTEALQLASNPGPGMLAVARFQSSGKTRLQIRGAAKAWLNGQALDLTNEVAPDLSSGEHILAVELDPANLPEVLRAESPDARFLGN